MLTHTLEILLLRPSHSPACTDGGARWAAPPLGIAASANAVNKHGFLCHFFPVMAVGSAAAVYYDYDV